jgi:acyl-coenzyme A thioesterase PaaI-like protein
MKRKINNPFLDIQGYDCFGCAPYNRQGLRMDFFEDGDTVCANWHPEPHFQGYGDVLHGGIAATLMEEVAGWVIFVKLATAGLTMHMEVKYLTPAYVNRGPLIISGWVEEQLEKTARIRTCLCDNEGQPCSEGSFLYRIYPEAIARKKLYYPGRAAFFPGDTDDAL